VVLFEGLSLVMFRYGQGSIHVLESVEEQYEIQNRSKDAFDQVQTLYDLTGVSARLVRTRRPCFCDRLTTRGVLRLRYLLCCICAYRSIEARVPTVCHAAQDDLSRPDGETAGPIALIMLLWRVSHTIRRISQHACRRDRHRRGGENSRLHSLVKLRSARPGFVRNETRSFPVAAKRKLPCRCIRSGPATLQGRRLRAGMDSACTNDRCPHLIVRLLLS